MRRPACRAGGAPRPVLEDVESADWSPDGLSLAVVRNVSGRERLEFPIGKILYEIKARPVYFVAEHDVKLREEAALPKSDARTAAE